MAIERLVGHFEAVRDPRCGGKIEHRLTDILVIAVCAVIACAESWNDIALPRSPRPRRRTPPQAACPFHQPPEAWPRRSQRDLPERPSAWTRSARRQNSRKTPLGRRASIRTAGRATKPASSDGDDGIAQRRLPR
jgi:hypothetical protein